MTARQMFENRPERLIEEAVRGMLPKNRWRDRLARRLKVYAGPTHPHSAQTPEQLSLLR
jgi:large subunit ribosomal protein L13